MQDKCIEGKIYAESTGMEKIYKNMQRGNKRIITN